MTQPVFDGKLASQIIKLALLEDIGRGDVTASLVPSTTSSKAVIVAREPCVIAGLPVLKIIMEYLSPKILVKSSVFDGDTVRAGEKIATLSGPSDKLLTGERTALNFMSIMSGIATITRRFVNAVKGTNAVIYDTRKTIPGHRYLSKYAVRAGGGSNHRMGLYDMILIKDNHIAAIGIHSAITKARKIVPKIPIMVEVDNLEQLQEALPLNPNFILLDNMTIPNLKKAVKITASYGETRPLLEASGGITIESVRKIAKTGVDRISIGAITHSYHNIDLSMEFL